MATVIRGDDNFDTTPPAYGRVVRTAGNITTTSTSLVDVTGASITITTGASPVIYGVVQTAKKASAGNDFYFNIDIDGSLELGTSGLYMVQPTLDYDMNASFSGQSDVLTAGSHTIKEQWRVSSSTGTIRANTTTNHQFYVRELR